MGEHGCHRIDAYLDRLLLPKVRDQLREQEPEARQVPGRVDVILLLACEAAHAGVAIDEGEQAVPLALFDSFNKASQGRPELARELVQSHINAGP